MVGADEVAEEGAEGARGPRAPLACSSELLRKSLSAVKLTEN